MEPILIEISWEVANKVGGIYTVLKEKARYIQEKFKNNYYLIGPFLPNKSFSDFSALPIPYEFEPIIDEVKKFGIDVYYGEWLIESRPKCFLIDYTRFLENINNLKYELWAKYRIDSLRTGDDYNHPIAWCKAVSIFLKCFLDKVPNKIILHLHEWLSGSVILFENLQTPSIFTTHATVLGRSMAESGLEFWEHLSIMNPDEEAYKFAVEAKHMVEKMSARKATFFTVISRVLAIEAEHILGRKPDFILPNGIDISKFPTIEEISYAHRVNREIIREFILYFFSPYYRVELKNSLFYFISGRKEIKNKGIDIFIRSLSELNKKLTDSDPNIFAFIFVPSEVIDVDHSIFHNLTVYRNLEEKIEDLVPEIKSRLVHFLIHKEKISSETLFSKEEFLEIQKIIKQLKTDSKFPISTHILNPQDEILQLLLSVGLDNRPENKVKVIYYPIYLHRGDGFLNLDYNEAIIGCHVGVFPSFYEPWGYTPLESAISGVITITTDLTGFSDYLQTITYFDKEYPGIYIIERKNKRGAEVVEELSEVLLKIARFSKAERVQNKLEARRLASLCSWDNLISNYFDLYSAALQR
jgi:glycogen(starch) synthase